LREKREAREAEVAEWSERLTRDAKHRETRQAAADNSQAWEAWFRQSLYGEFRGKSPLIEGIAEFTSTYTRQKRAELRRELRSEFEDRQRALEARCAALEQRLENVAQGKREKFAFANKRNSPSPSRKRKVVRKVRMP
jgi:hypothetical protein